MDNKQELDKTIDNLKTSISAAEAMLAILEAQLAEAEKPKLRHGDYGFRTGYGCRENDVRLFVNYDGILRVTNSVDGRNPCEPCNDGNYKILGNVFDSAKELIALAEPLEKFEMKCGNSASWSGDGKFLNIYENNDYIIVAQENLSAFILNLRRMEANPCFLKERKEL